MRITQTILTLSLLTVTLPALPAAATAVHATRPGSGVNVWTTTGATDDSEHLMLVNPNGTDQRALPSTAIDCPNPEGGACIGPLKAGKIYSTQRFVPQITYQVNRAGWFNYEDLPGNFLLVPPGNDLAGVNAGTADYIGVYTAIQPSHLTDPASCTTEPLPGRWNSPRAVAGYFWHHPTLRTSRPAPVSVGGLNGFVVTSRINPNATLDRCTFDDGTFIELAGLFSGIAPSGLEHTLTRNMTMRLFLLSFNNHVLAIELDDIHAAPATLAQLTKVAHHLHLDVGCS